MQKTFDFYEDPGHGWLKVPKALLTELGIADKITPYSYQRKDSAFLEEDCDLTTFVDALRAHGVAFDINASIRVHIADKQSKIRNYESYRSQSTVIVDALLQSRGIL